MKDLFKNNTQAFTLIEIMVVVVIVAILASIGIPKYMKTVDETNVRNIRAQLITLHAANKIYLAQDGDEYLPGGIGTLAYVNDGLNINIILPNDVNFVYTRGSELIYLARATYPGAMTYTIDVDQDPIDSSNPSCTSSPAGGCP